MIAEESWASSKERNKREKERAERREKAPTGEREGLSVSGEGVEMDGHQSPFAGT